MAKILVKLKEASFLDLYANQYVMAGRPYVVENSSGIQSLCAAGKMEVICNTLDQAATDAELVKFLEKNDQKGFLAKYDLAKKKEAPAPTPEANGKENGKENGKSKK